MTDDKKLDMINHPPHYNFSYYEPIEVIEDWNLGFHEGCAVKYISRARHKGKEMQDLMKAIWYLERKVELLHAEAKAKEEESNAVGIMTATPPSNLGSGVDPLQTTEQNTQNTQQQLNWFQNFLKTKLGT